MPGKWPLFKLNKSVFEPCINFSLPHLVRNESELPGLTEDVHACTELIWRETNLALASQYLPLYENLIRRLGGGREVKSSSALPVSICTAWSQKGVRPSSPDTMIEHIMQSFSQYVEALLHETWFWWQTQPLIGPSSSSHGYDQGDEFEIESTGTVRPYRNKKIACSLVTLLSWNS